VFLRAYCLQRQGWDERGEVEAKKHVSAKQQTDDGMMHATLENTPILEHPLNIGKPIQLCIGTCCTSRQLSRNMAGNNSTDTLIVRLRETWHRCKVHLTTISRPARLLLSRSIFLSILLTHSRLDFNRLITIGYISTKPPMLSTSKSSFEVYTKASAASL